MTHLFTSLNDPGIAQLLNQGAVGVIPTDTVYGLVASVRIEAAIERMYMLKPREQAPGTIVGASTQEFVDIGFPQLLLDSITHLWPAPVSCVVDATNVSQYLKQHRTSLPVRIPDMPSLIELLNQTGPLMTTSANMPKQPVSESIQMAMNYFGDDVDFYVDGGDMGNRSPSTIIGFHVNNDVMVYRQGAKEVSKDTLREIRQKIKEAQ